jgi:lipopolysaccharide biosynthesis regulator YciM
LSDFKHELSTYNVDLKNGHIEAVDEDDHRRAMEAQEIGLKALEMQMEGKRLDIQLAQMQQQRRDATAAVLAKFAVEDQNSDGTGEHVSSDGSSEDIGTDEYVPELQLQPSKRFFPSV